MNNLACLISSYLVNSLWEVTTIAGAGWAVARLLKRLGPRVEHLTWVATLTLAVTTPMLTLWRPIVGMLCLHGKVGDQPPSTFVVSEAGLPISTGSIIMPHFLIMALSYLYLGALFFFAVRLGWSIYRTIRLSQDTSPALFKAESDGLWSLCKRAFSLENTVILTSKQITGPVTIGFVHPVLLLPEKFTEHCTPHEILAAFAHECAHMKRHDFQKNLFYEITSLIISYHPVTWIVKSQISQTREIICDGMATERLIDSRTYARSLLRLATMISRSMQVPSSNAIGIFDANILEKRIMMMRTKKQHLSSRLRYCLITSSTLFLFSVAAGGGAMARSIEAQTPNAPTALTLSKGDHLTGHSCTYYDDQDRGYPGTCGTKRADKQNFYCFLNENKKISEIQIGCSTKR